MNKSLFNGLLAVFLAFCVFVLTSYSGSYAQIAKMPEFAQFVFVVVGAKLGFILCLVTAAFCIGGVAFGRIMPAFDSLLEEGLIKSGLGLTIIAFAVFVLGMVGALYPAAGYVLLVGCIAAGQGQLRLFIKRLLETPRTFTLTFSGALLVSLCAYILIHGLYLAFLPPREFDVLMYHFGAPRQFIDAHRMFPTPDINGSSYPFAAEMLYMLGMLTESDISANLVNSFFGIGCAVVAYAFTRRFIKSSSALLSATIFLALPLVGWLLPNAYIEFAQAFFIVLATYALVASFAEKGDRWMYVSAILAGMSMAIKYTSNLVFFILVMGAFYKSFVIDKAGAKKTAIAVVKYGLIATIVVLPWYIKNFAWYGNPFYPMMAASHTGGKGDMAVYYEQGMSIGPLSFLMLPWNVTMKPAKFYMGEINSLGPYFLMFIPGIALFRNIERELKYLMTFCLLYMIIWFVSAQNIRYLVPVSPFLAVLAAYPVGRLLRGDDRIGRAAGGLFAAMFAFAALMATTTTDKIAGFPSSSEVTKDTYYTEIAQQQGYLSSYGSWKWINANLPQDAVIFQLWDDASVYFRQRRTLGFPSTLGDHGRDKVIVIQGHNSFGGFLPGEEIVANMQAMGVTHLFINANREGRAIPEDAYFQAHTKVIMSDNGLFLFEMVY